MTARIVFISFFMSLSAFAYEANLNIDWKFKKIGSDLYGLDAALKAGAKDGRQVFDLDYDESGMERVSVPHCVNAHDTYDNRACDRGEAAFWRGWMLYRKTFRVPPCVVRPREGVAHQRQVLLAARLCAAFD